jgi:hypothetical protein
MKKFNFKLTRQQEKDFNAWIEDGNVIQNQDNSYSTQDAQYRNRLKDMDALKEYFYKEFLMDYAEGGMTDGDVLTKPRTSPNPTTTPTIRPARPSEDNPYKPKIAPRPKASKYDFIFMKK